MKPESAKWDCCGKLIWWGYWMLPGEMRWLLDRHMTTAKIRYDAGLPPLHWVTGQFLEWDQSERKYVSHRNPENNQGVS